MTLHRIRFARSFDATRDSFDAPSAAKCWRFCPSLVLGDNDLPTWNSGAWGGLGLYSSHQAAQDVFDAPATHLPCANEAIEQWHALLLPFAHRGEVKWRDDATMQRAAYQPGVHRALMDRRRDGSLFGRSSFTRARLMASSGSWDGNSLQ